MEADCRLEPVHVKVKLIFEHKEDALLFLPYLHLTANKGIRDGLSALENVSRSFLAFIGKYKLLHSVLRTPHTLLYDAYYTRIS